MVLRAIDANANRVAEALRVVEDVLRFVMEDRLLTQQAKDLRHDIATAVLAAAQPSERFIVRDTQHDPGTDVKAADEMARMDSQGLVDANLQRAKQSLRSLEEHFKLRCQRTAARLEQLRYQTYTLEKLIAGSLLGRQTMKTVSIYALIDAAVDERDFELRVRSLIQAGIDAIQLREKRMGDRELLQRCRLMVDLASGSEVLTFVNDRPDVARLARTTGVHLGQDDLPIYEARRILHPSQLVGVSTHSWEQAESAVLSGANYLGIGPIFPSRTKHFEEFVKEPTLNRIFREISVPVLAIGGITVQNVERIAASGATRIAVSGAMSEPSEKLAGVVGQFRQRLNAGHQQPFC
jgi:thiamine-phosphate pyrophosphorylase